MSIKIDKKRWEEFVFLFWIFSFCYTSYIWYTQYAFSIEYTYGLIMGASALLITKKLDKKER